MSHVALTLIAFIALVAGASLIHLCETAIGKRRDGDS